MHNQNKCSLRGKLAASNGIPAADDPLRGVSILVYPHAYIAAAAAYENEIIIVEKRHSNICLSHYSALLKCAALTFEAILALLCIYSDNVLRQTSLVKQLPVWNNAIMDVGGDQLVRQDI